MTWVSGCFVSLVSSALIAATTALPRPVLAASPAEGASESKGRAAMIAGAHVWEPTPVPKMDLRTGPDGPGSFPPGATVSCEYRDIKLKGRSPKFVCALGDGDEVKVKYGGTNGEVYGEVAATRLLWALGFGADRMYPVRIICRGCPREFGGIERQNGDLIVAPAVIERKFPGKEYSEKEGWKWNELDIVADKQTLAERDALKLLAVLVQHTDNKAVQQRLLCRDERAEAGKAEGCRRPFMMVSDLGLTFGKASLSNANSKSGMNLTDWVRTPIWKDEKGGEEPQICVGNLPKSFSGTLDDPVISEDGRRFLAGLLEQLTDKQLHDLFEVAQVNLRTRTPNDPLSGMASVSEWVDAFKAKRDEIVNRRCAAEGSRPKVTTTTKR